EQALAFEEKRLAADFANWPEKMGKITRGFDSTKGTTYEQRRKEEAADYRYFPEPDIPPISFSESEIEALRAKIIELPKQKHSRYVDAGIRSDVAEKLVRQPHLAEYLETSTQLKHDLAVFVSEEVTRAIAEKDISFEEYQQKVPITKVADLLNLVAEGIISKTVAKEIFNQMIMTGDSPADIIRAKGLEQVSDSGELEVVISRIVKENPDLVEKYRAGKTGVLGFFVGNIMQATGGKANPQVLNKLLKEKLDEHIA
ncbi:MAG: Asp-tRNA(Asn)/Glu-tRNA(Gln) amidotransferase GatCAB subunit B, partial [Candidatus Berkelbacteria bacterium]